MRFWHAAFIFRFSFYCNVLQIPCGSFSVQNSVTNSSFLYICWYAQISIRKNKLLHFEFLEGIVKGFAKNYAKSVIFNCCQ